MKKLLALALLSVAFVGCGNKGTKPSIPVLPNAPLSYSQQTENRIVKAFNASSANSGSFTASLTAAEAFDKLEGSKSWDSGPCKALIDSINGDAMFAIVCNKDGKYRAVVMRGDLEISTNNLLFGP